MAQDKPSIEEPNIDRKFDPDFGLNIKRRAQEATLGKELPYKASCQMTSVEPEPETITTTPDHMERPLWALPTVQAQSLNSCQDEVSDRVHIYHM